MLGAVDVMPRVYEALSRIHADPNKRRGVWAALSRVFGGAYASWHKEWLGQLQTMESECKGDGFKGVSSVGLGIDDYTTFDGVAFPTGSENSVRTCSFLDLQKMVKKAKCNAERSGVSNGVEHDLSDLIDEVAKDLIAFGCRKVRTPWPWTSTPHRLGLAPHMDRSLSSNEFLFCGRTRTAFVV